MKDNTAAVYCRLSKEDLDKDTDKTLSESIKNQKAMLEAYALERGWDIYDFYIDEDYSGSDRDRPEFNRLIADSLLERFGIVLCKKQSRFARDIEYVEKYIHGLFTEKRIRFVAVLDSIDTGAAGRSVRKASQINSLVDEWYLSDLSENIVSALTVKRKNAEFIGSWAPYGYRKDPCNKNSLLIDPEAAEIVREIFERCREGFGIGRIARELNGKRIPNPLLYKQLKGEKINPNPGRLTGKRYLWNPSTISSILHNQTYAGHLIQGKYKKASYKSKKLLRVPRSDWIVAPHCHESIIDDETWGIVQKILQARCRVSAEKQRRDLTAGKVYCGECGSRMSASGGRSGTRNTTYLCCSKHRLSKDACSGARIEALKLEQALLERIRSLTGLFYDETFLLEHVDFDPLQPDSGLSRLKADLCAIQDRLSALERNKVILYADKLEGIISSKMFKDFMTRQETEAGSLRSRQQALAEEISATVENAPNPVCKTDILEQFRIPGALTREMVDLLVESVYVFKRRKGEPQEITINWNF